MTTLQHMRNPGKQHLANAWIIKLATVQGICFVYLDIKELKVCTNIFHEIKNVKNACARLGYYAA